MRENRDLASIILAGLGTAIVVLFGMNVAPASEGGMSVPEMVVATKAISSEIDVAASRDTYVSHSDPTRLAEVFASDSGGVFCGGQRHLRSSGCEPKARM